MLLGQLNSFKTPRKQPKAKAQRIYNESLEVRSTQQTLAPRYRYATNTWLVQLLPLPHPQDAGPLWRRPHGLGISRVVVLTAGRKRDGDGSQRRREGGVGEEVGASGVAG